MASIKLLDFGVTFSGDGQMARPRRIAWPVKAFRVTLPDAAAVQNSGLNPFELLMFRLLDAEGPISEERLAKETCIPEDFVKGVLLRLQDKGFIDDRHNITKKVKTGDDLTRYKPAMVFQELVEGKVLPYVYYNTRPAQKTVSAGTYCWQMAKQYRDAAPITSDDVRQAIKEQRRHERAYGDRSELPIASSIRVSAGNESYYLDCPIGMRASDGEFRIGNPFGKGYSVLLEGIFVKRIGEDENLENWINAWRESLKRELQMDETDVSQPYDTPRNRQLYPRLIASLKPNRFGIRSIENIYSSIEWALFYANERTGSRNAVNLLRISKESDTPLLVRKAADEIGLEAPDRGFLRVQGQSLDSYLDEVPEMPTALAIAILTAKGDDAHPIARFAVSHPDAAVELYRIKRERDNKSHGKGREAQDGQTGRNELFMRELISAMLPEISFGEETSGSPARADEYVDSRFEARSSLILRFGYAEFNTQLDPMTQDRLVDAECFWNAFSEGENALPFVGDLYAAMQSELGKRIKAASIRSSSDSDLANAIEKRAQELGIAPLPDSLSTVRPSNIRKALQGFDETTLGALVVAFMLTANEEQIDRLLQNDRSFFSDAGEVIAARGHLNEARAFSKKEVDRLRELAYRSIGALMED